MDFNVYICSLPNGYFGSAEKSWQTLDVKKLSKCLVDNGFNVIYTDISKILEIDFKNKDVLIYTSLDNEEIRNYLKDVLFYVKDTCLLIPSYEMLLSHENKGFQEVFRRKYGINSLDSIYNFDINLFSANLPCVIKTVNGSGSNGVKLIRSKNDLDRIKLSYCKSTLKQSIKKIVRSYQLSDEESQVYNYRYKNFQRYITQNFIENLSCDYRVLVVGDKYFTMRRDVRDGDFRASGSKKFNYHDSPKEVLDYAKEVFEILDNPYISMDIALQDKKAFLIEYQGTNFGSSVLRNSDGYYKFVNDAWIFIEQKSQHEETFSQGYLYFIEKKLNA